MLRAFLSTFGVTFVAELPDKTAFATLLLATRGRPGAVFVGAAAAFTVHCAIAVAFGSLLSALPAHWVRLGAGAIFLVLAAAAAMQRGEEEGEKELEFAGRAGGAAAAAFVVIFLAEWGDLTQFSTAALAAHFRMPAVVFCGATLGLWAVTGVSVAVGSRVKSLIKPEALRRAAVAAFALVGLALLVSGLRSFRP